MSLSLDVAGVTLPTSLDAVKSLRTEAAMLFHLPAAWHSALDLPLGSVSANLLSGDIQYGGPQVQFPLGPVQFGLEANAAASLALHTSGALLSFEDGLDQPATENVAVPSGTVYLALTLRLTVSGNATFNYSGGEYGVTSELDATRTYAVSFYKAFAPSTPVRQALPALFECFVLPLHKDTFRQLGEGDYLLHEFDGKLHLAIGAYAGIQSVMYAGQSAVDLSKTQISPLATFSVQARPTVKAGVNLSVPLDYSSQFEALLSRTEGVGSFHLFRSTRRDAQAKLSAGITVTGNASVSLTPKDADALQGSLVAAAGGVNSTQGKAVSVVLSHTGAVGEIQKCIADVNDKLNAWAGGANGRLLNLELAMDGQAARTVVAAYTFDLESPAFDRAWACAYNGDLVAALATGAATLDVGSGLEQQYQRKTACTCNVFDLFRYSNWDQFASDSSLVYAGHNTFHLVETVGHTAQSEQSLGALHSLNLYFTAQADVSNTGTLSQAEITLHLDLTARNDKHALAAMVRLLGVLGAEALAHELTNFGSNSPQGVAELNITVSPAAYSRITSSDVGGDATADIKNWQAFADASDALGAWPLQPQGSLDPATAHYFKSYFAWQQLNIAATGEFVIDRTQTGNAANQWPETFPAVTTVSHALVVYSLLAGQHFMNFCAALQALADLHQGAATEMLWTGLNKELSDALKQEADVDFIRPAMLAVIRLCGSPPNIQSPLAITIPKQHFAVTCSL